LAHPVHWPDRITNKELWKKTNEEPVLDQLRRRKWNWTGHTLRSSDDSIAKQVLQWTPQCHRERGRPTDQETRGKEIWRGRCGQRASGLAGGRWRRQDKTELDGDDGLWPMLHWEQQGISQVSKSYQFPKHRPRLAG